MSVDLDAQAKIDAGVIAIENTSAPFPTMVRKYGPDWAKWPKNTNWYIGLSDFKTAHDLLNAPVPVPTPTPPPAQTDPPVTVGALMFSDHFDGPAGSKPNSSLWDAKDYKQGDSLAHWMHFNNIALDGNGNCIIDAQRNADGTYNTGWLSSLSTTAYSGQRYVEARVKVAKGFGTWTGAPWEWNAPYGAGGIEIDVCEQLGREPNYWHITQHNWDLKQENGNAYKADVPLADDYHIFGGAIFPDHIDYYLDNVFVTAKSASSIGVSNLTTYKVVMNLTLNMGGWGQTPPADLTTASTAIDFVNVYHMP